MVPSKPLVKLIRDKIENMGTENYYILDGSSFFIQDFPEIPRTYKLGKKL